jgi:hypothetical protein
MMEWILGFCIEDVNKSNAIEETADRFVKWGQRWGERKCEREEAPSRFMNFRTEMAFAI